MLIMYLLLFTCFVWETLMKNLSERRCCEAKNDLNFKSNSMVDLMLWKLYEVITMTVKPM